MISTTDVDHCWQRGPEDSKGKRKQKMNQNAEGKSKLENLRGWTGDRKNEGTERTKQRSQRQEIGSSMFAAFQGSQSSP